MSKKLKEIFDNCSWGKKYYDTLPGAENIRYLWREEDAYFAYLFMEKGVMHENTAAVERALYLGKDSSGAWQLCVTEITQADYDPKKVAFGVGQMMDPTHIVSRWEDNAKKEDS